MRRLIGCCLILLLTLVEPGCASIGGARTEPTFSWAKVRGWLHLPEPEADSEENSGSTASGPLYPVKATGGEDRGSYFMRRWQGGVTP